MSAAAQAAALEDAADKRSDRPAPLFQPFEWVYSDGYPPRIPMVGTVELVGRALDVANGVRVILRMLEQVSIDSASCDEHCNPLPPLLDPVTVGHLLRFGISASDLLAQDISRYQERLSEEPAKGATP